MKTVLLIVTLFGGDVRPPAVVEPEAGFSAMDTCAHYAAAIKKVKPGIRVECIAGDA